MSQGPRLPLDGATIHCFRHTLLYTIVDSGWEDELFGMCYSTRMKRPPWRGVAFVRFTITCSYYEFQLQFGIPKDSKNIRKTYCPPPPRSGDRPSADKVTIRSWSTKVRTVGRRYVRSLSHEGAAEPQRTRCSGEYRYASSLLLDFSSTSYKVLGLLTFLVGLLALLLGCFEFFGSRLLQRPGWKLTRWRRRRPS
jgi:hypothetical protein